jgi:hypothetical protein
MFFLEVEAPRDEGKLSLNRFQAKAMAVLLGLDTEY